MTKYHNAKTELRGVTYDSKKEAKYAEELYLRVCANDIYSWRRQVPLRLNVQGHHICKAVVDFVIMHNDGSIEYVEVKGYETAVYKLKRKLIAALYPDIKYTVVK